MNTLQHTIFNRHQHRIFNRYQHRIFNRHQHIKDIEIDEHGYFMWNLIQQINKNKIKNNREKQFIIFNLNVCNLKIKTGYFVRNINQGPLHLYKNNVYITKHIVSMYLKKRERFKTKTEKRNNNDTKEKMHFAKEYVRNDNNFHKIYYADSSSEDDELLFSASGEA